ncbi:hypothetical protein QVD17_21186 [Tagetes erecta]|uniref:Uncharacterized protein n=1 Tax=Tagetes erecta TaxID=13708 RepID=A0AAD8KMK3_TARER|nr:hypothetical protein QVD17_21186 [Tagetes erecta]
MIKIRSLPKSPPQTTTKTFLVFLLADEYTTPPICCHFHPWPSLTVTHVGKLNGSCFPVETTDALNSTMHVLDIVVRYLGTDDLVTRLKLLPSPTHQA